MSSPSLECKALLPAADGFEGFGSLLEQPKASDLPVLDREHVCAPRYHFDPLAPSDLDGVRQHDLGARFGEAIVLLLDVLERRPELAPEGLVPAATIDTLERPSGRRPVNFRVGAKRAQPRRQVAPVPRFDIAPHSFDVLLRHRPCSISRRSAAFHRGCRGDPWPGCGELYGSTVQLAPTGSPRARSGGCELVLVELQQVVGWREESPLGGNSSSRSRSQHAERESQQPEEFRRSRIAHVISPGIVWHGGQSFSRCYAAPRRYR